MTDEAPTTTSHEVAIRPEPKAALVTGGSVTAIIPRSIEETYRLAGAIHGSGMAPNTLNSPDKVMVAIMAGAELGLPPFQAIQSFAMVNNRPVLWGDGFLAVLRSNGFKVKEWFDNEDAPTKAFCLVTRPDNGEEIERTFSLDDAKKANLIGKAGTWQTNQKRMLQMRARGFAGRDGAADVLRGFQLREEVEDYVDQRTGGRDAPPALTERLKAQATDRPGFSPGHVDAEFAPAGEDFAQRAEAVAETVIEPEDVATFDPEGVGAGDAAQASQEEPGLDITGLTTGADLLAAQEAATGTAQPKPSLTARADLFAKAIEGAANRTRLEAAWTRASSLRGELDKADPERLAVLDARFNQRHGELTA